jgi:hypothetical protein
MKIVYFLLVSMLFTSCSDSISDIMTNPAKYDGKTVTVSGKVSGSTNLLLLKFYILTDGTSELYVSTKKAVPNKGDEVTVTGKVSQLLKIGNEQVVGIEEQKRK